LHKPPTFQCAFERLKNSFAYRFWPSKQDLCVRTCSRARQNICGNSLGATAANPKHARRMRLNNESHPRTCVEYKLGGQRID
jgi:hypothetical protein